MQWDAVVKDFKPPITESRYALLAAAKSNGNAIGVTELCVAPNPVKKDSVEEMGLGETAPYLSNLAGALLSLPVLSVILPFCRHIGLAHVSLFSWVGCSDIPGISFLDLKALRLRCHCRLNPDCDVQWTKSSEEWALVRPL